MKKIFDLLGLTFSFFRKPGVKRKADLDLFLNFIGDTQCFYYKNNVDKTEIFNLKAGETCQKFHSLQEFLNIFENGSDVLNVIMGDCGNYCVWLRSSKSLLFKSQISVVDLGIFILFTDYSAQQQKITNLEKKLKVLFDKVSCLKEGFDALPMMMCFSGYGYVFANTSYKKAFGSIALEKEDKELVLHDKQYEIKYTEKNNVKISVGKDNTRYKEVKQNFDLCCDAIKEVILNCSDPVLVVDKNFDLVYKNSAFTQNRKLRNIIKKLKSELESKECTASLKFDHEDQLFCAIAIPHQEATIVIIKEFL